VKRAFLFSLFISAVSAQIIGPGQYPPGQYPPGQYPPGRYPGGRGQGNSTPGRSSKTNNTTQQPALSRNFSGVIRILDEMSMELEESDTRFLTIQLLNTTTKPAALAVGDGVDVVASEDKDHGFQAVSIKANAEIAAAINERDQLQPQPQERTGPPPTILRAPPAADDDESGPPKLKRGKPERASSRPAKEEDDTPAPLPKAEIPPSAASNSRQGFIEKAREAALAFTEGLPNYVCQESTTRYISETKVPSWTAVDIVAAEVVFEEGKESYRNLTINGKPTKKAPEESGAWSTGEFGTILGNLFAPYTAADFRYVQDATVTHQSTSLYSYKVERLRSSWKIWLPGQYIRPAYRGSVWIDKQGAHVLRLEMEAREIPTEFPEDSVETAVDYDYISLGTTEKFLLPVHAEVLACFRGSSNCERNVIEFRNYHKFTGESTIKFN
jgi:hypothetical protein